VLLDCRSTPLLRSSSPTTRRADPRWVREALQSDGSSCARSELSNATDGRRGGEGAPIRGGPRSTSTCNSNGTLAAAAIRAAVPDTAGRHAEPSRSPTPTCTTRSSRAPGALPLKMEDIAAYRLPTPCRVSSRREAAIPRTLAAGSWRSSPSESRGRVPLLGKRRVELSGASEYETLELLRGRGWSTASSPPGRLVRHPATVRSKRRRRPAQAAGRTRDEAVALLVGGPLGPARGTTPRRLCERSGRCDARAARSFA
jgi:hypothetical protein